MKLKIILSIKKKLKAIQKNLQKKLIILIENKKLAELLIKQDLKVLTI